MAREAAGRRAAMTPTGEGGGTGRPGDRHDEDALLVGRCLEGDRAAWAELLTRHRPLIMAVALRNGLRPEEAEEMYQSVCLTMLERLELLRGEIDGHEFDFFACLNVAQTKSGRVGSDGIAGGHRLLVENESQRSYRIENVTASVRRLGIPTVSPPRSRRLHRCEPGVPRATEEFIRFRRPP